jgi:hypothetical protein
MSHSCAQWRGDIGAYIVGALDGRARDRVTRPRGLRRVPG